MMQAKIKSNLHTHSSFCDGTHTPEEVVRAAVEAGMECIGFSGHSYTPFDDDYTMSPEGTRAYCREILRLKEAYADRIRVLLGVEQDICAPTVMEALDFRIASAHYIRVGQDFCCVDHSFEIAECAVTERFGGDWYRYTKAYYEGLAALAERDECDIVGHFDLVAKFNEKNPRFDESHPRYLRPALEALDALLEKDVLIEVNTGAIARGYRRMPYPMPIFLRRISEKGGRVVLSSDAHDKNTLLYGFDDACQLLHSCGIGSVQVMGMSGWRQVSI